MNKTITLDGREITYTLERKKVKNINLRVRSDATVYVSANKRVSESTIEDFLQQKARFILSALDKYAEIAKHANSSRDYVTGESFPYLGRELCLVVNQGKKNIASDGVSLFLTVPDTEDSEAKSKLIKKWYDVKCNEVFSEIIFDTYPIFQKCEVSMPKLKIRDMKSRWGSCQYQRGIITLNKRLIETSRDCIEYVVMHEFIHFLHHNHSKRFYEMLQTLMPDWKQRKKYLEKRY